MNAICNLTINNINTTSQTPNFTFSGGIVVTDNNDTVPISYSDTSSDGAKKIIVKIQREDYQD